MTGLAFMWRFCPCAICFARRGRRGVFRFLAGAKHAEPAGDMTRIVVTVECGAAMDSSTSVNRVKVWANRDGWRIRSMSADDVVSIVTATFEKDIPPSKLGDVYDMVRSGPASAKLGEFDDSQEFPRGIGVVSIWTDDQVEYPAAVQTTRDRSAEVGAMDLKLAAAGLPPPRSPIELTSDQAERFKHAVLACVQDVLLLHPELINWAARYYMIDRVRDPAGMANIRIMGQPIESCSLVPSDPDRAIEFIWLHPDPDGPVPVSAEEFARTREEILTVHSITGAVRHTHKGRHIEPGFVSNGVFVPMVLQA